MDTFGAEAEDCEYSIALALALAWHGLKYIHTQAISLS